MSIRLKFIDNKIRGVIPAGRRQPDYVTIFPDKVAKGIDELLDEYGNGQYEIRITETEDGKQAEVVKKRMAPTAEQIARRKKQLFKQYYAYDRDDEIALMKDAINALQVGKEVPMDYTQMELDREAAKQEADDEIEADLFKIAEEHKDVSR
jgi:bisphosphoglycerate-independent phosphoglycerate mutase (AlkP superfamily)